MVRLKNYVNKTLVVFSALAILVASVLPFHTVAAVSPPSSEIIGGHAASEPYPGMASLQIEIAPGIVLNCGATLVSRLYVATNAHCVTDNEGKGQDPGMFQLRIGSHNRLSGGVVVGVTKVLPHADWDWATGGDPVADIALLKLDQYVQLQPFEIAPHLAHRDATTRLLGWGVTEPSGEGELPINLQELDTKLVSSLKCMRGGITAGELCVSNANGTDGPCYGDSGSPALQKVTSDRWSTVGGTSRAGGGDPRFCGSGPAIYTDLTYYRNWMYQVMRTGTVPPATTGAQPVDKSAITRYNWLLPTQWHTLHSQQ